MTLDASYLDKLRNGHPHVSKQYASILRPAVVYCGTVTGSPAFGARTITVANISGNIANITAGMTVYVGTSSGDYSISKRRLRSRAGQVLTLDENTVDWDDGNYLTVVKNFELWPIFPYIDELSPGNFAFYKDRDIVYTDQNRKPSPVAIMGGHSVKYNHGGYPVTFPLVGSSSYTVAVGATISSYAWTCSGASIVNSTSATATLSIPSAGWYLVSLTVTDSNGKTQTTRRWYIVYDDANTDGLITNLELGSYSGNWQSGGWRNSISAFGNTDKVDLSTYPEGALVIFWSEDWFNGIEAYNSYCNVDLVGYLKNETIDQNFELGTVSFDVETMNSKLTSIQMMSVSLENTVSPTKWYQYYHLTVPRAVHHFFKWHSTLFDITDVYLPNNTLEMPACDDFDGGDLYSMVNTFTYEHGIFAHLGCDKRGLVYLEQDFQMLATVSERANLPISFTLSKQDIQPEFQVIRRPQKQLGYCTVEGASYSGGVTTPLVSQAPGEIPYEEGPAKDNKTRLVLQSQTQSNRLAGRVLAVANRKIEELRVKFVGNYAKVLDVFPQHFIWISDDITTDRGESLEGRWVVRSINETKSVIGGVVELEVSLEPEAFGPDGIAGPYPPPVTPGDGGGGDDPGNGNPVPPPWIPPDIPPDAVGDMLVVTGTDIRLTYNFDDDSPLWETRLGNLEGAPIDASYAKWDTSKNTAFVATSNGIWKTDNLQQDSPTWTQVFDSNGGDFAGLYGTVTRVVCAPSSNGIVYGLMAADVEGGGRGAYALYSYDNGETWESTLVDDDMPVVYSGDLYSYNLASFVSKVEPDPPMNEEAAITPGGSCEIGGNYAYIHALPGQNAEVVYSLDRPYLISSITFQWKHNGDTSVLVSENGSTWTSIAYLRQGWGAAFCGPETITIPGGPRLVMYVKIIAIQLLLIGDSTNLAYFSWYGDLYALPVAIDCGKNNSYVVYVSTKNGLYRSDDGAATFNMIVEDFVCNDIEVPIIQDAGDLTANVVDEDEYFYQVIGTSKGLALHIGSGPMEIPIRISSDVLDAFPWFIITNGATSIGALTEDGTYTQKFGDLSGGRSLRQNIGDSARNLYWLDETGIWYSADSLATRLDKTGDWTDFAVPIAILPLV